MINSRLEEGPAVPMDIRSSCVSRINDTHTFFGSGRHAGGKVSAFIYSWLTDTWTQIANMVYGAQVCYCELIGQSRMIMLGGWVGSSNTRDEV